MQINIGVLADKRWQDIPAGGSPWHEYTSYNPSMACYFPHPKLAPFLPADWVAKNRELLLAKAAVLRELGLDASFQSTETFFLPEAFFEKYPHLRGPRVDHPRRSKRAEFTWCVDLPETLEMIEWMAAELKRNVPEIQSISGHANDSGTGFCWAAALYSGSNGPRHCASRSAGIRFRDFALAIQRGAEKGGGKVAVHYSGNSWQQEQDVITPLLGAPAGLVRTRTARGRGQASTVGEAPPITVRTGLPEHGIQ